MLKAIGALALCFGLGFQVSSARAATAADNVRDLAFFWQLGRYAADQDKPVELSPRLRTEVLAKAEADECFNGVGVPATAPPCAEGVPPKVNQAYVWGQIKVGSAIWFGTLANTHCLVESGFLGVSTAQVNDYWVCEFGENVPYRTDWRPPKIYRYDLKSRTLAEKILTGADATLLRNTVGLRSAGELDGVVFLAGPALTGPGINMFAFDASTGALLGSKNLPEYSDIRSWLRVDDSLYCGVGVDDDEVTTRSSPGGYVLRWVGEKSTNPSELFRFAEVGALDSEAANLAEFHGKIYVSTWPTSGQTPGDTRVMAIWQSPSIPDHGLTPKHLRKWNRVWRITDYDPDPIAAATTGGGAIAALNGVLYWGTMHVPFVATQFAMRANNVDTNGDTEISPDELAATALGTHRSIAIFAGKHLGRSSQTITLLYGEKYLPLYDAAAKSYTIAFDAKHLNRMRQTPRWGASGFGNFFNTYTWAMQEFDNRLYIGTFDWSQLARVGAMSLFGVPQSTSFDLGRLLERLGPRIPVEGADLFWIQSTSGHARAESLDGVGNSTNYGIRTFQADEKGLYVGTANPMNLHPEGGWELLKMTNRYDRD